LLLVSFRPQDLDFEAIRKRCLRLDPITEHRLTRDGKLIRSYFTSVASGYQITKRSSGSAQTVPTGSSALGQSGSFDRIEKLIR
jgi:hypothetical protein